MNKLMCATGGSRQPSVVQFSLFTPRAMEQKSPDFAQDCVLWSGPERHPRERHTLLRRVLAQGAREPGQVEWREHQVLGPVPAGGKG